MSGDTTLLSGPPEADRPNRRTYSSMYDLAFWHPDHQHAGPPIALMCRAIELALRVARRPPPRFARFAPRGPRAGARQRAPGRGSASVAPRVAHGWQTAFRWPRWKTIRSQEGGAALPGHGRSVRKTRWRRLLPHVPPRHSRAAANAAP